MANVTHDKIIKASTWD